MDANEPEALGDKLQFLIEIKEWFNKTAKTGHAYVKKAKRQE
jgi:hypothetical protein